ncbi:uncharacterized protein [Heptranchias perlo]|uniref:uncharacterized protein n=1 Tax=Heptranchias perlo TaxID=212740 RepID=UPI003559DA2C
MVCYLPGGRVKDITERVQNILRGEGEQPEVVVHVGTNDIGRKRIEVLQSQFQELGRKFKKQDLKDFSDRFLPHSFGECNEEKASLTLLQMRAVDSGITPVSCRTFFEIDHRPWVLDKLWCNTPGAPFNSVEVILQNFDETKKFVKTVNIEPLKYRGYDSAVIKEKHGCDAHPCMNNGKCVLKPESTAGYICICPSAYSGEFCQCATSINTSASSFLTSGCVVVLLLLIALGYLIYLHFFRERNHDNTAGKITENRQPYSKTSSAVPKSRSSEPTISRYHDSEFPTGNVCR